MSAKPGADDPEITNFRYWNPEVQDDPHPFFDKIRATTPGGLERPLRRLLGAHQVRRRVRGVPGAERVLLLPESDPGRGDGQRPSGDSGGDRSARPHRLPGDPGFIVLLAGLDTTHGVLSLSMEYLANKPSYRQDLLDNPDLLPSAVKGFLRWFAPVLPGRRMTRDVEVRGVPLKEGDRVMLGMGSACRDAEQFGETAGEVDFRRSPNRHIAFGVGAHRCLGSHLARLELQISPREWHRQIRDYRIPEGAVLRKLLSAVRGVDELPIVVL